MGEMFSGFLSSIFGWFASVLPEDPFSSFLVLADGLGQGIGWLNWLFPVSEALTFLGLWIAAVVAYVAIKKVVSGVLGIVGTASKVI